MAKKPSKPSILQQVETDLRSFLSQHQQLILNERELQLRIAQFLLNTGCYSNVYLEYMLPVSVFPTNTHKYLNTHNFSLCHGITWRVKNWLNNQTATAKGRPDIVLSGQHPIRPWTKANIGQLNNGSNVTPIFKYTYTIF